MKIRIYSILLVVVFSGTYQLVQGQQEGFRIEIEVGGISDTSLILAHRYGNKFYTDDTIRINQEGYGVFEAENSLPPGMYQIVFPDKAFLEFFVDDKQYFKIITEYPNVVAANQAIGHSINQLFFDWHRASQTNKNSQEMQIVWDTTLLSAGNSIVGDFLRALRPFDFPQELKNNADFMQNQQAQYHYYKKHFFDVVDFGNPALLRSPIIHNKLKHFFSQVVPPQPDSIAAYCDQVLHMARASDEVFRYTLQFLLNDYSEPKIMGTDAVYVYLAEKYYLSGQADWVSKENLALISSKVDELKPLLIGQTAPEFSGLVTPMGEMIDPAESDSRFKILYFWEPNCGHCKTATPELFDLYPELKAAGAEVFAINSRLEKEIWLQFIADHELTWINLWSPNNVRNILENYQAWTTPKIFILDQANKILAKDLVVSQVKDYIQYLERMR